MGDEFLMISANMLPKSIYFKAAWYHKSIYEKSKEKSQMNARDFFYLVAEMREAQKAYLETKDRHVFRAARKLENEVDKEIRRVRELVNANPPASVMKIPGE